LTIELYNIKKNKVFQIETTPFNLEKDIQKLVEQNTQELFNLDFVSSEFSLNEFRIDTLCYDEENNSFVIVEYKKGKSYSVIDQGYSYLSLMLNNKSDFILEYNENKKNNLKRDDVDWSSSKVIFISPSFNTYQKNSVNFQDVPFELWEIKKYSNNMISLNLHQSTSKESIQKLEGEKDSVIKDVGKEIKVFTEDDTFSRKTIGEDIRELYEELKEKISDWEGIRFNPKYHYIGVWKKNKGKFYLNIRKNCIRIHIVRRLSYTGEVKSVKNKFSLDDPKKLFHEWNNKYKELYEYDLKDNKNLDYLVIMLKQKFDY
jgi:hypothetical protein